MRHLCARACDPCAAAALMAYLGEKLMLGAIIALDDPYQEEKFPHAKHHYGQILFAHELVSAGDYAPVHVPWPPPATLGNTHGPLHADHLRALQRMAETAEYHGDRHFAPASNTVVLRRMRARVDAADQVRLSLEDASGARVGAAVSLPL